MGELRRVRRRGNSWVIAVPYTIRRHLGVELGTDLYWHLGAKGEAHLTTRALRVGGKPPGQNLEKALAAAQQTITKLERQARARPRAVFNEGVNEGFEMHLGGLVKLGAALEALTREVRDGFARMPFGQRRHVSRARSVQTASVDALPASTNTPPPGSSPVVVAGGDAASGAASPQAAHE